MPLMNAMHITLLRRFIVACWQNFPTPSDHGPDIGVGCASLYELQSGIMQKWLTLNVPPFTCCPNLLESRKLLPFAWMMRISLYHAIRPILSKEKNSSKVVTLNDGRPRMITDETFWREHNRNKMRKSVSDNVTRTSLCKCTHQRNVHR